MNESAPNSDSSEKESQILETISAFNDRFGIESMNQLSLAERNLLARYFLHFPSEPWDFNGEKLIDLINKFNKIVGFSAIPLYLETLTPEQEEEQLKDDWERLQKALKDENLLQ